MNRIIKRLANIAAVTTLGFVLAVQGSIQAPAVLANRENIRTKQLPKIDSTELVVKFKDSVNVDVQNNDFVIDGNQSASNAINDTLNTDQKSEKDTLVETIDLTATEPAKAIEAKEDLKDYFVVELEDGENAKNAADELIKTGVVESAYPKPMPAPAPSTPNFTSLQTYLQTPSNGMGVRATIGTSGVPYPNTTGRTIKIADIEYSWNTQHEDLPALRRPGALWANGTPVDPFDDNNHGTAVASVITGAHNGLGVDGIVPDAEFYMVNAQSVERGWDVAGAVYTAAARMTAGDIILIEQQAWAPDHMGFAPVEIYPAEYDAIRYATAKGIIVIEPAGNGRDGPWEGYNLDSPMFNGAFTTRPHSGAVIVGAGSNGCSGTPKNSRMPFSNYGSRVTVHGFGECVMSAGYGLHYYGHSNATYTSSFAGTSSASAMVAGAAAIVSAAHKTTNGGVPMNPAAVSSALQNSITNQNWSHLSGNIGPLPTLSTSLRQTDITAPIAPLNLRGRTNTRNRPVLIWSASTDNLGVISAYRVYRNGTLIGTVTNQTTFTDLNASRRTTHSYTVVAVDASGNASAPSNTASIRTR